jgi:hypothetical protein
MTHHARTTLLTRLPLVLALSAACTTGGSGTDAGLGVDAFREYDAGLICGAGTTECSGECVSLMADDDNCGACGNMCPSGVHCAASACTCEDPKISCDGVCVDPSSDPMHCGGCDVACASGQMCTGGACVVDCDAPGMICRNPGPDGTTVFVCADLETDPQNCGTCNTRCAGGALCMAGGCACPSGQVVCRGACVDVATDADNCGACGIDCGPGGVCEGGACTTCGTGTVDCSGRCIDTMTDPRNCGTCGTLCAALESCVAGSCTCAAPLMECGGACTNTATDLRNCGGCGVDCGPGGVCTAGACTCATGLTMCGGSCVDTAYSREHCGGCDMPCDAGELCITSTCTAAPTSFRIDSLSLTGCTAADHASTTGDDCGGIAVGTSRYYYTGDSATGSFDPASLTMQTGLTQRDGLFSDLWTGQVWTLTSGGSPYTGTGVIDGIQRLDADLMPMGSVVALSTSITLPTTARGVFSGLYRVILVGGGTAYQVSLPGGMVTSLGAVALDSPYSCETWAFWGVAELFGGMQHLVYRNSTAGIVRTTIGGTTTTLAAGTYTTLSDMCSIAVDLPRNRWVFHHEYTSSLVATGGENVGHCPATFSTP